MDVRLMLTDEQWSKIQFGLPGKSGDPGRTGRDNRLFVEAILYLARTGAPWRDLPSAFGPWNSVYRRFARWAKAGIWERLFGSLSQNCDLFEVALDSTTIKTHKHAAGALKNMVPRRSVAPAAGQRRKSTPLPTAAAG